MGCGDLHGFARMGHGAAGPRRDRHAAAGHSHVSRWHLFRHVASTAQGFSNVQAAELALRVVAWAMAENPDVDDPGTWDVGNIAVAIPFLRSRWVGGAGSNCSAFFDLLHHHPPPGCQARGCTRIWQ